MRATDISHSLDIPFSVSKKLHLLIENPIFRKKNMKK